MRCSRILVANRAKVVEALAGHDLILVLGAPGLYLPCRRFRSACACRRSCSRSRMIRPLSLDTGGYVRVCEPVPAIRELLSVPHRSLAAAVSPRPGTAAAATALTDDYLMQQIAALRSRAASLLKRPRAAAAPCMTGCQSWLRIPSIPAPVRTGHGLPLQSA